MIRNYWHQGSQAKVWNNIQFLQIHRWWGVGRLFAILRSSANSQIEIQMLIL